MENVSWFGKGLKILSWFTAFYALILFIQEEYVYMFATLSSAILVYGFAEIICILHEIKSLLKENKASNLIIKDVDSDQIEE